MYFVVFAVALVRISFVAADIAGVSPKKAALYEPKDGKFECLDGSRQISFEYVNDDYCDCPDGTDEPGTSACPNAWFYCKNEGYVPKNIPSSRVNDFICDCCDGSDESGGSARCENTCMEMGRELREETERKRKLAEEGYRRRQQWSEEGRKAREEKEAELNKLEAERDLIAKEKDEKETAKKAAEDPEKAAKDEFDQKKQAVADAEKAREAFAELDVNSDGMVDLEEVQKHPEFDIDNSGEVSVEEAKEHLEDHESVDVDTFVEHVWSHVKDVYKPLPPPEIQTDAQTDSDKQTENEAPSTDAPPLETPPTETPEDEAHEEHNEDDQNEDDHNEDDHDDEDDYEHDRYSEHPEDEEDSEPTEKPADVTDDASTDDDYPEEVKNLIKVADEAREAYSEVERRYNDMNNQIKSLQDYLALDLGPDRAFHALQGQCYEFTDREYTYKLCPFQSASQRPKDGGSETSLGRWENWSGGEGDEKYSQMKYTNGQNCWNGPNRSVTVTLHCGEETALTSAAEPNRCEYAFDLYTPAVCSLQEEAPLHSEL